ncbi:MAG: methyltransferase domain-containing protein [Patescibacteria group bacterium]
MRLNFIDKPEYTTSNIDIDGQIYDIRLKRQVSEDVGAPRLIVVSYLPDKKTIGLLRCCIETIQKFTDTPHELWIIDNNSPEENIEWLDSVNGINLVLSRTQPAGGGSYANAIGLEIGRRLIDQNTKYLMTLHQDIVVCKDGWLQYLLSKFDTKTAAVGVRFDDNRVKEGILHVLGYIVDFQIFKKLNLNFFPELPAFDVGDKAIVELKKAGYGIFATPNSIWDKNVTERLPEDSPFKDFHVDRSVDDDGDVIFMHLGRGVYKSTGAYTDTEKSIGMWESFIEKNLLPEKRESEKLKQRLFSDNSYSSRRYFVDKFFIENIHHFRSGEKILDIGGKKTNKRGVFDISKYPVEVEYANIDASSNPDYLCDATKIPVKDSSFDGAILAEVLEHVRDPRLVLAECFRMLKPGGKLLITVPFMFHVHADPDDYGRYTEYYFRETLKEIGFRNITIRKQGGYYCVLANIIKMRLLGLGSESSLFAKIKKKSLTLFISWFQKKALIWDEKNGFNKTRIGAGHTTGYGIICEKR